MQTAQERAYSRLRERLRRQLIRPGSRLNISSTADELGVSIIPLREAMARLATEGLLERLPGNGFRAPGLSVTNVEGDFTVVFLFLRHVVDLRFQRPDLADGIVEMCDQANERLAGMRDDPDAMALEAEAYVRNLLPLANSAKLRHVVEAALDSSTVYREVYYRKLVEFDAYLEVRRAFVVAMREGDESTSRYMVTISQQEWEGKTRDLCRYAWVELFDESPVDLSLAT